MIFSTYSFIFLFFPAVFILYRFSLTYFSVNITKIILIVASLVFYAFGAGEFFFYFLLSIIMNYLLGGYLANCRNLNRTLRLKISLWIGLILNLLLLGYFKYYDFAIFNLNLFPSVNFPYKNIVLPIGISFFTFQLIAYLVDSYRGETQNYGFLNYLMFITFFPQLIVGPIVHHKDVVPQYESLSSNSLSIDGFTKGLFLFFMGAAKKLVMADPLSDWAQKGFDHATQLGTVESWMSAVSYTMSYYFDLSGYADMAIGLGIIFGVVLPRNFNSPYKARNFADYWRRWHITLSKFLGDYIFRNVFKKGKGDLNFYWAIFVTFLVSGFWHGAGWTFVVWGIVNGVFVIMSHAMTKAGKSLPFIMAWILTMLGVIGTRVLFVSKDFNDAWHVLHAMIIPTGSISMSQTYVSTLQPVYIAVAFVIVLAFPNSHNILERFKYNFRYMAAFIVFFVLSILNMSHVRGFLYFQF